MAYLPIIAHLRSGAKHNRKPPAGKKLRHGPTCVCFRLANFISSPILGAPRATKDLR